MLERAEVRRIQKSWSRAQLFYNTMKYHLVLCGKRGHVCVPNTNSTRTCAGGRFYRTATALDRPSDSLRTDRYRSPHTTIRIHNHAFTAFLNMSVSAPFKTLSAR